MEEEPEEGEEETERQRMEDQDYQFPSNPSSQSTQSSTAEDEDSMREPAPKRLESLSAVASRYHLTHTQAVSAGNASYEDLGIFGPTTTLDQAKLLRARITFGDLRTEDRLGPAKKNVAVSFDERINDTVVRETVTTSVTTSRGSKDTTNRVQSAAKEEHCPVVMYGPDGKEVYIETHKLESGVAPVLADKVFGSLEKQESEHSVKVVGSDSCAKNTGAYAGVAACLELGLGRPLQRVLCLKHTIELVWHRFFKKVDGKTKGPTTLDGPIGKKICNNFFYYEPIVDFKPINLTRSLPKLSLDVVKKMSEDQKYLYRIAQAVMTGSEYFQVEGQRSLATASPGKFHNARWITLANRILRLYCSTNPHEEHYKELERMVRFLIDVYCHAWFDVVKNTSFLDGPRCFQRLVASLNTFKFKENELVEMKACINQNRQFFVHLCLPLSHIFARL